MISLLWALRSPCHLGCQYCYFGANNSEGYRRRELGELSHKAQDDISARAALQFARSIPVGLVNRVFLAGGEPLLWTESFDLIECLKSKDIEVVVCTNGLPLLRREVTKKLLDLRVDAISVSLDSHDKNSNDKWRKPNNTLGWEGVVSGIRHFLTERAALGGATLVGVYMVVTTQNIDHLSDTADFVEELGCDYFIFQPVSLRRDHPLHHQLSLSPSVLNTLNVEIEKIWSRTTSLQLPDQGYLVRFRSIVSGNFSSFVPNCFGGKHLFFIQPDGTVWDCPSSYKIENSRDGPLLSIARFAPDAIFRAGSTRCTDCNLFSVDCVNMWQLMAFDRIIEASGLD